MLNTGIDTPIGLVLSGAVFWGGVCLQGRHGCTVLRCEQNEGARGQALLLRRHS